MIYTFRPWQPQEGEPAQIARIYRDAADTIESDGWIQGRNHVTQAEVDAVTRVLGGCPAAAGRLNRLKPGWCATAAINQAGGRPLSGGGVYLFRPLAGWLLANQPGQVKTAVPGELRPSDWSMTPVPATSTPPERLASGADIQLPLSVVQWWNDFQGRTKDEVLGALRACAAVLDELEGLAVTEPPG